MGDRDSRKDASPRVPPDETRRRGVTIAAVLICAVVGLAFSNSFGGVFVLDDLPNIVRNPAIRTLWPPWRALANPPLGLNGRPLVTLTLALNYAVSGEQAWSYHVLNLLIHILAALTLMGILRRTLLMPRLHAGFGGAATPLAAIAAVIWAVHPLQTQAITYVIQRCESLMGLFFLLTLYAAIRGWQSPAPRRWHAAAIAAFLAGAGSKEVIAAAPPLVFLYDLLFVHERPREALRGSRALYAGLLIGLVLLAVQVVASSMSTLGLERLSITSAEYARTQPEVILHYLRLAIWPHPLVLDYQWPIARPAAAIVPGTILLVLLGATAWACWRRRPLGYPGAWFFLILAPSSSVIPIRDLAFEHRMYLPLASVVVLAVVGAYALARRRARVGMAGALVVVTVLGFLTFDRNRDYRSELTIWTDTVAKRPLNAGAHLNLGAALDAAGRTREAREHTERAARLNPASALARNNLGCMLAGEGDLAGAATQLEEATRLDPTYAEAQYNLGNVLHGLRRFAEAEAHYRRALELQPGYFAAQRSLGRTLQATGKLAEAAESYRLALRMNPRDAEVHHDLGGVLLGGGRLDEALASFREAARLKPDWLAPQNAIAWILATHPDPDRRDPAAAVRMAEQLAARTGQQNSGVLDTLAAAYAAAGRFTDAIRTAEQALAVLNARGPEGPAREIEQRLALYRQGQPFVCAMR